jgi:hypothetical protein
MPTFVKTTVTRDNVSTRTWNFLYQYNEKYVQTGSLKPLNDVLIEVFFLSYSVGWPIELRHLKHAEEAAKHTAKGGRDGRTLALTTRHQEGLSKRIR